MAKLLSRINHSRIVLIFAVLFFVVYSHLALSTPPKFVSVDELTNHFFIDLYSRTGELSYSDDLNEIAGGIIRPTHVVTVDGNIVPKNFLGFTVMGGAVAAVSPEAVRFITPLLAVLGAIFLYLLLRDIFDRRVALLTFLLLLISAPYWYWSSREMMENVAACTMLIISLRYLFKLLNTNEPRHYLLTGLFFGLSVFIRAEYVLLGIPMLVLGLWNVRKLKKAYAGLTVLAMLVALGPLFVLNRALYGSALVTGAHAIRDWDISRQVPFILIALLSALALMVLIYRLRKRLRWQHMAFAVAGLAGLALYYLGEPFGGARLANLAENSLNLIALIPLLFALGLVGFLYCLKKREYWEYMALTAMCLLVLSVFFLTGRVVGTTPHASYVRYLLPGFVLFLPFVSYLILRVRPRFVAIVLVLAVLGTGIHAIDARMQVDRHVVASYSYVGASVAGVTEPEAVIFVEYWDRAIFPERRVSSPRWLPATNRAARLSEMAATLSENGIPVYVYLEPHLRDIVDDAELREELLTRRYVLSETAVMHLYSVGRDPVLRVSDFDREDIISEVGELRDGSLHSTGRPGLLVSGPCVPMKAGEYTLVVTGAASSTASARVEVVSGQGDILHARLDLEPTADGETGVLAWGLVSLDEAVVDREVRVYVGGDDEVRLDGYEFIPVLSMRDFDEGYPFSRVGRFRDRSIVSDGREGFLVFGPYAPMDAGRYMLVVTGAASSPVSAWVDVVSGRGALEHARFPVSPAADDARGVIASGFLDLDEDVADLEVRLYVGVHDDVRLDGYSLVRVFDTMDDTLRVRHFGRPGVHSQVGELHRGSLMSTGQEGFLVFGPYTAMTAGEYSLVVTGMAPAATSARVDIVSDRGSVQHAEFAITPTEDGERGVIAAGRVYLDADVADLEVRVYVGAEDDVRLDGYELVPVDDMMESGSGD